MTAAAALRAARADVAGVAAGTASGSDTDRIAALEGRSVDSMTTPEMMLLGAVAHQGDGRGPGAVGTRGGRDAGGRREDGGSVGGADGAVGEGVGRRGCAAGEPEAGAGGVAGRGEGGGDRPVRKKKSKFSLWKITSSTNFLTLPHTLPPQLPRLPAHAGRVGRGRRPGGQTGGAQAGSSTGGGAEVVCRRGGGGGGRAAVRERVSPPPIFLPLSLSAC